MLRAIAGRKVSYVSYIQSGKHRHGECDGTKLIDQQALMQKGSNGSPRQQQDCNVAQVPMGMSYEKFACIDDHFQMGLHRT